MVRSRGGGACGGCRHRWLHLKVSAACSNQIQPGPSYGGPRASGRTQRLSHPCPWSSSTTPSHCDTCVLLLSCMCWVNCCYPGSHDPVEEGAVQGITAKRLKTSLKCPGFQAMFRKEEATRASRGFILTGALILVDSLF
ncbi:hypothetical protein ACQJBY_032658 [Aegilops geniculata]